MGDAGVKKSGVKLLVAGEYYEDSKPYEDLINKFNLHDSVILHTHYVPSEQVRLYFSAADLVVQPYRSATQSGVTQIAYHFDKPMLVTRVGGLAEIVPHQVVGYVTPVDAQAIAYSIADFYDQKRSEEFIANIRTEKKRFLWSSFVEGILKLYRDLT